MDLHPKICNLCNGRVIMVSARDAKMYGCDVKRRHYVCTQCRAFVRVFPGTDIAKGILANQEMRRLKGSCHAMLDPMWYGKKNAIRKRESLYLWLSKNMHISKGEFSFDRLNVDQLKQAHQIISEIQDKEMKYDKFGHIFFEGDSESGKEGNDG